MSNQLAKAQEKPRAEATRAWNARKTIFATWGKRIAVSVAVLMCLLYLGPVSKDWERAEANSGQSAVAQRNMVEPEVVTMTVTNNEWSQPVIGLGDHCIRWWTDNPNPGGDTISVQVRGINAREWIPFREWRQKRESGQIKYNPGWFRFRANRPQATVHYTLLTPSTACS